MRRDPRGSSQDDWSLLFLIFEANQDANASREREREREESDWHSAAATEL